MSMPHMSVIEELSARGAHGELAKSGAMRYDLEPLLPDTFEERHHVKVHLFCEQDKSTLRIARRLNKRVPNLAHPVKYWESTVSYTVSAKRNQDGSANFNLYSHNRKQGLRNMTSRPELVLRSLPGLLGDILLGEARRLFEQNIRPWREPDMALPLRSDIILYNTYPAYFQDITNFATRRRVLHKQLPQAILPMLRLPSAEVMVDRLFGQDKPAALYHLFEGGAPAPAYTAALLWGKLISPEEFLRVDWNAAQVAFELASAPLLRKLLNRCDAASHAALFADYVTTVTRPTPVTNELADIVYNLRQTTRELERDIPYREIAKITNVTTFAGLNAVTQARLTLLTERANQQRLDAFGQVVQTFSDLFDVGDVDNGFTITEHDISLAMKRGARRNHEIPLVRKGNKFGAEVIFHGSFFGKHAPLPANHALQAVLKHPEKFGMASTHEYTWNATPQQATAYLHALHDALVRVARRHQVPVTKAALTRLLHYLLYYYSLFPRTDNLRRKIKPPAVPAMLYPYLLDDTIKPEQALLGITWNIQPAHMHAYDTLPESAITDLLGKTPVIPGMRKAEDI